MKSYAQIYITPVLVTDVVVYFLEVSTSKNSSITSVVSTQSQHLPK